MKKFVTALLVAGLASSLFAAEHVVDQLGKKFIPDTLSVKAGDTIRFKNSDPFAHNAFTDEPANEFDTGMQAPGEDTVVTVKAPGTFNVECAIHPAMLLTVTAE